MFQEEEKACLNGFEIPIQCILMEIKKGADETALHYHDYVELLYGIDCDTKILCDGKEYTMRSGDITVINSKQPHTVTVNSSTAKYIVIKFMPQILYAAEQSVFEFKYLIPFLADSEQYKKSFKRAEIEHSEIPSIMNRIMKEWNEKNYGYEIALRIYVTEIVLWLIRRWNTEEASADLNGETDEVMASVQRAVEYAQKSFQDATSEEAAKLCNLSYSYFSRIFKRIMKKSFTDYVTYVKLSEAKRLLSSTDKSITDISFETGFSTTSYFIERFKSQVGMTPMKFRKICRSRLDIKEEV